jgi:hypothetical protein
MSYYIWKILIIFLSRVFVQLLLITWPCGMDSTGVIKITVLLKNIYILK